MPWILEHAAASVSCPSHDDHRDSGCHRNISWKRSSVAPHPYASLGVDLEESASGILYPWYIHVHTLMYTVHVLMSDAIVRTSSTTPGT